MVLEGFRRFDVLPDIFGFYRIYTLNVLPMFYQISKMFYQISLFAIKMTIKL